jgi:hypothetical protein
VCSKWHEDFLGPHEGNDEVRGRYIQMNKPLNRGIISAPNEVYLVSIDSFLPSLNKVKSDRLSMGYLDSVRSLLCKSYSNLLLLRMDFSNYLFFHTEIVRYQTQTSHHPLWYVSLNDRYTCMNTPY